MSTGGYILDTLRWWFWPSLLHALSVGTFVLHFNKLMFPCAYHPGLLVTIISHFFHQFTLNCPGGFLSGRLCSEDLAGPWLMTLCQLTIQDKSCFGSLLSFIRTRCLDHLSWDFISSASMLGI